MARSTHRAQAAPIAARFALLLRYTGGAGRPALRREDYCRQAQSRLFHSGPGAPVQLPQFHPGWSHPNPRLALLPARTPCVRRGGAILRQSPPASHSCFATQGERAGRPCGERSTTGESKTNCFTPVQSTPFEPGCSRRSDPIPADPIRTPPGTQPDNKGATRGVRRGAAGI